MTNQMQVRTPNRAVLPPDEMAVYDRSSFSAMVEGLLQQGFEQEEALETLQLGLHQANCLSPFTDTAHAAQRTAHQSVPPQQ